MGEGVSEQPSGILGEIMAELGLPLPAAEDFRRRRLDAASSPVRNETAFLRVCIRQELEAASKPSKAKSTTSGRAGGSAKKTKGKRATKSPDAERKVAERRKQSPQDREIERFQAVAAVEDGEPIEEVAADLGVGVATLKSWIRDIDNQQQLVGERMAIVESARSGESPEVVAKKFGVFPGRVESLLKNQMPRCEKKIVELAEEGLDEEVIAHLAKTTPEEVERVLATGQVSSYNRDTLLCAVGLGEPVYTVADQLKLPHQVARDLIRGELGDLVGEHLKRGRSEEEIVRYFSQAHVDKAARWHVQERVKQEPAVVADVQAAKPESPPVAAPPVAAEPEPRPSAPTKAAAAGPPDDRFAWNPPPRRVPAPSARPEPAMAGAGVARTARDDSGRSRRGGW
jgi:hypothetical protein